MALTLPRCSDNINLLLGVQLCDTRGWLATRRYSRAPCSVFSSLITPHVYTQREVSKRQPSSHCSDNLKQLGRQLAADNSELFPQSFDIYEYNPW